MLTALEIAKKNGCHHTILYRDEDFVAKVKEITSGKLCDVVYDGIGKATFPAIWGVERSGRLAAGSRREWVQGKIG